MRLCLALALSFLWASPGLSQDSQLELLSRIDLTFPDNAFGGLSGISLTENGTRAILVSDRSHAFNLELDRDVSGKITKVRLVGERTLHLHDAEQQLDAESAAIGMDGSLYLSNETYGDILRYRPGHDWPRHMPKADLNYRHQNRGIEALAADDQGRLIIIPERPLAGEDELAVYMLRFGKWVRLGTLPVIENFMVTGADVGPEGSLYILERAVSLLGFRSQLRRTTLPDLSRTQTLFQSKVGEFDNLEGVDVWRDPQGRQVITMVSDDNFLRVMRSEIVEFLLNE